MGDIAIRDLVWDAALRALVSNTASIRIRDVKFYIDDDEDVSDRTVRRTLNAMESLGYLSREMEGGHYWFPGPKTREYLRVPNLEQLNETTRLQSGRRRQTENSNVTDSTITTRTSSEIENAVEDVDVHAHGDEMTERRRTLLENILKYIRDEDEVKPSEIRARFYPDSELVDGVKKSEEADAAGYGSDRSWWKNFVYSALSEIDLVETGGKGSHTWFYVDKE